MSKQVRIEFIKDHEHVRAGQTAKLKEERAKKFIDAGIAQLIQDEEEEQELEEPTRAQQAIAQNKKVDELDEEQDIQIPKPLRNGDFVFIRCASKSKRAIDKNWTGKSDDEPLPWYAYNDQELQEHLARGGNYGVLTGHNELAVSDEDHPDFQEWSDEHLPDTLTVLTGSGGRHKYYQAPALKTRLVLDKEVDGETVHYGELQSNGQQVIGPSSYYDKTFSADKVQREGPADEYPRYEVTDDQPIAQLTKDHLNEIRKAFTDKSYEDVFGEPDPEAKPEKKESKKSKQEKKYEDAKEEIKARLKVPDLLSHYGITLSKNPTMCPLGHSSEGKKCLSYEHDVWKCHHCNEGGDVFEMIRLKENLDQKRDFREILTLASEIAGLENEFTRDKEFREEVERTLEDQLEDLFADVDPDIRSRVETLMADARRHLHANNQNDAVETCMRAFKQRFPVKTIRDDRQSSFEMYVYFDGVYHEHGMTYVQEFVRMTFRERTTEALANHVIKRIAYDTYIDADDFFDSAPLKYIPVQNGLLNIYTQELEPFTPKIIFLQKFPVEYDPAADCPQIKEFYEEVLAHPKDVKVMQEFYGFVLMREYRYQYSFMCHGRGSNGKSVHLDILREFVGPHNKSSVPLDELEQEGGFAVANLHQKYVNIAGDIGNRPVGENAALKRLTGGDSLNVDRKYQTRIEMQNYAKLIFSCNELPPTKDNTDGWWRRWMFFDFPNKYVMPEKWKEMSEDERAGKRLADPNLKKELPYDEEERKGLLNWAIQGLARLTQQDDFTPSPTNKNIRETWNRRSNSFFAFCRDHLERSMNKKITKTEMRRVYSAYCAKHDVSSLSDKAMKITLQKEFQATDIRLSGGDRERAWVGICWKEYKHSGRLDDDVVLYDGDLLDWHKKNSKEGSSDDEPSTSSQQDHDDGDDDDSGSGGLSEEIDMTGDEEVRDDSTPSGEDVAPKNKVLVLSLVRDALRFETEERGKCYLDQWMDRAEKLHVARNKNWVRTQEWEEEFEGLLSDFDSRLECYLEVQNQYQYNQ